MLKMFTVYDSQAEAYLPPFCARSVGEAMRSFEDAANDEKSNICRYPHAFTLFEVGAYDDDKGQIVVLEAKKSLAVAVELKRDHQEHAAVASAPELVRTEQ